MYFIYSVVFSLVFGLAFGRLVIASRDFLMFAPAIALAVFALLLAILEVGLRINLLRAVFGGRLKRSPAQWRTHALQLSLALISLATLNALLAFFAPLNIWLYYKVYGGPLLFAVGVFATGWIQVTPSAAETITAPVENSSAISSTRN
ncbi:septation protein IspZ [Pseudomonas fluorescens]|uniref:septation protein IspZ n=1 Tax=Pseudomonas fluorescens TaxID=294 RepID=UPI001BE60873|nr:septation protein IspZ [Pseudomonas fluorescens]